MLWCIGAGRWHSGLAPPFEAHSLGWKKGHLQWGVSGLLCWTGRIGRLVGPGLFLLLPNSYVQYFNHVLKLNCFICFFWFQKQQFARPIKLADFLVYLQFFSQLLWPLLFISPFAVEEETLVPAVYHTQRLDTVGDLRWVEENPSTWYFPLLPWSCRLVKR